MRKPTLKQLQEINEFEEFNYSIDEVKILTDNEAMNLLESNPEQVGFNEYLNKWVYFV